MASYPCNKYEQITPSYPLSVNLTRLVTSFLWFKNSIDQAVAQNKCQLGNLILQVEFLGSGFLLYMHCKTLKTY